MRRQKAISRPTARTQVSSAPDQEKNVKSAEVQSTAFEIPQPKDGVSKLFLCGQAEGFSTGALARYRPGRARSGLAGKVKLGIVIEAVMRRFNVGSVRRPVYAGLVQFR